MESAARTETAVLASIALILLMAGGMVAYAAPFVSPPALDQSGSTSSPTLTFNFVPAPSASPRYPNGTGNAYIRVEGQYLTAGWVVTHVKPGSYLQAVLSANSTSSTRATTVVLGVAQANFEGTAQSGSKPLLDPGDYAVGLKVYDLTNTNSPVLVFASDPSSAKLTVQSSDDGEGHGGGSTGFTLVPLPVYLHQVSPTNYPFKEGGAVINANANGIQVIFSFLGTPNTQFNMVLARPDANVTLGSITTNGEGGGVFKANVTIGAGTYSLGLLVFDNTGAKLLAVSMPRSATIAIGSTTTSKTSTTTTYTTTHTSTRSSTATNTNEDNNGNGEREYYLFTLTPVSVSSAPSNYRYGNGTVASGLSGSTLYFSGRVTGQNPNTRYQFVVSLNGTTHTIGNYTTNRDGSGSIVTYVNLGHVGTYLISVGVVDASSFPIPVPVLAGNPTSVAVHVTSVATTTTTSRTTTATSTESENNHPERYALDLVPVQVQNAPSGYRLGQGNARLYTQDQKVQVFLNLMKANPLTTYQVNLTLNGTATTIGTMTTNGDGNSEFQATLQLNPGTYVVTLQVYDTTSFKQNAPVLVIQSSPSSPVAIIVGGSPSTTSASSTTTGTRGRSTTHTSTNAITTISGGTELEDIIRKAVDNLTIPVVVQVTALSSSANVLDPHFSVSVGKQPGTGIVIALSGSNVTGPRVLLVNLSRTSPLALFPALNVTLDGSPVSEASSASQVLSPAPGDPARYVIVSTSSGLQLIISIPHFSLHLIQVSGMSAPLNPIQTALELSAPLLAGSALVVTLLFGALYAARRRIHAFLI